MPSNAVVNKSDGSLEGILNPDGCQRRLTKTNGFPVKAKQIGPRIDLVEPGDMVFPDVEGSTLSLQSGTLLKGNGRVGIAMQKVVRSEPKWLRVYDTYDQQEPGWSRKSGVYADDLLAENYARPIAEVMENVRAIFTKSGVIIGHSLINEQQYLRGLPWSEWLIFDIQAFSGFKQYARSKKDPKPALKDLAQALLGRIIQERQHDPIEDCMAGGDLFFMHEEKIRAEQSSPEFQRSLLWSLTKPELDAWALDPTVKALGERAWFPEGAKRSGSDKAMPNANATAEVAAVKGMTAGEEGTSTIVATMTTVSIATTDPARRTHGSDRKQGSVTAAATTVSSTSSVAVNPKQAASSNFWGQFKR